MPATLFLVSACTSFPYSSVIKESTKYVNTVLKKSFHTIKISDTETAHYLSAGNINGPLVILIHGSPGSWGSFAHFYKDQDLLSKVQLITFDRFGYGKNRAGIPHLSLHDQSLIPRKLIEKYAQNRKTIILGHSYGGPVAAQVAISKPKEIHHLILVASSMDPELEKMKWYQHIAKLPLIRSLIPDVLDVVNREILGLKDELIKLEKSYPYQYLQQLFMELLINLFPLKMSVI